METLLFFWLLLKASLLSTGGLSNLPMLYDDLTKRGWASERHFAEALAVGKVSPGPSGLWVISLGYLVDGLRGALLATGAILIPTALVLPLHWMQRRVGNHPLTQGFVRGLVLGVSGIFAVVLVEMMRDNGIDAGSLLILAASIWLGNQRQIPFVLLLGLAAAAGVWWY